MGPLEEQQRRAVAGENFGEAARLRDQIRALREEEASIAMMLSLSIEQLNLGGLGQAKAAPAAQPTVTLRHTHKHAWLLTCLHTCLHMFPYM